jgi:hypothetical protein
MLTEILRAGSGLPSATRVGVIVAFVSLALLCIRRQDAAQGLTEDHDKATPPVTNGRASKYR